MKVTLQKDNISLKSMNVSDAKILFELIDKNRTHLGRWFSWVAETKKVEDIQKFLEKEDGKNKNGEGLYCGIWYEHKFIGHIGFNFIEKLNKNATIGYWLDKEYVGRGIMTKACKLLISYGFNKLHLNRVSVTHAVGNIRSENIIKQLGFIQEGQSRKSALVNGEFVDHIHYGLLVNEWKE